MQKFQFKGSIPASKSILNRLLIIQSYASSLKVSGDSNCDDVIRMREALPVVLNQTSEGAHCGAAGTTFRFLALRASRLPGRHLITGSERLLERPQETLIDILKQLGVQAELRPEGLQIESQGWQKPPGALRVDRSKSSQFASGVLLNAWGLDFDLKMEFTGTNGGEALSEGYFSMTEKLVQAAGMKCQSIASGLLIPKGSTVSAQEMEAEIDVSSAFSVAALGALAGSVEITNWPDESLQPDAVFPRILEQMGASVDLSKPRTLKVEAPEQLNAVAVDLGNCPDLFPVLSALCAFADGESQLFGAPQLVHKESSRIETSAHLVKLAGREVKVKEDGMNVLGRLIRPGEWADSDLKEFNPSEDHRLAMAAALVRLAGVPIKILEPEVVNKSYPEYWQVFIRGGGELL